MVVLPGAAYLDAAFSAAAECTNHSSLSVESVRFLTPLVIEDHGVPCISVTVEPSTMRLAIASHAEDTGQRTVHCTGRIVDAAVEPPQADVPQLDGDVLSQDEFYARLDPAACTTARRSGGSSTPKWEQMWWSRPSIRARPQASTSRTPS